MDVELMHRFPAARGRCFRYIDDVTLYADSHAMGLEFAEIYAETLEHFDLAINQQKTRHQEWTTPPDPPWRHAAQTLITRLTRDVKNGSKISVTISALSEILDLVAVHGVYPLKYIMTVLSPTCATRETWPLFEDFIGVIIRRDGLMLPHAHRWLLWASERGYIKAHSRVEDNLQIFALEQIRSCHAWEVGYVVNILTDLGSTLDTQLATSCLQLHSDPLDLLLVEATSRVRRLRDVGETIKDRACTADAFTSGHWLAAYEVQLRNPGRRTAQFSSGHWMTLAGAGVSFMREPAASPLTRWYRARIALRTRRQQYVSVPDNVFA